MGIKLENHFCEKPIATSVAEGQEILSAEKFKVKVQIGSNHRYFIIKFAKKLLDNKNRRCNKFFWKNGYNDKNSKFLVWKK